MSQIHHDLSSTKDLQVFFPNNAFANELELPKPQLKLDFRMCVDLNPKIDVGQGPWGQRNWISFAGGQWYASWGSGTVLSGGQDSLLIIPDSSSRLDTRYLLQTNDTPPAYIFVKTNGWRIGSPEVLERLMDPDLAETIKPTEYSFRLYVHLETGDNRYYFLNTAMWIGSAARLGNQVIYDAYRIS